MRRRLALIAALLALASPALAQDFRYPKGRPVDLEHLKLSIEVDLYARKVTGVARWKLTTLRDTGSVTFNAVDHAVSRVTVLRDGRALPNTGFVNTGEQITVRFPEQKRGVELSIELAYQVEKTRTGLHWFSPSKDEPDVPYQVWSQGEPIDNRHWFPCIDHPNERQSTELVITVPKGYYASSNGALLSTKTKGEKTTYHWLQKRSHVAYLVTLIVGQFEVIKETWRGKPVEYYVPIGWKKHAKNSFGNTKRMLDFFSEATGQEYPWDKYNQLVVEQFSFGGMENTSATTLIDSTLHDDRAHLDFSSDGLVAHELAHQWFGDLITCKDWAHIWLNEGFATYFEALWHEHDLGRDNFEYNMFNKSRGAIGGGRERPIIDRRYAHPINMFDGRAYPKGAWTLHQLRRLIGDEAFFRGIRTYVQRRKETTVETADLRRAFEDVTGFPLERFFYDRTERAGVPQFRVRFQWHADQGLLEVNADQTQKGEAFHCALAIAARLPGEKTPFSKRFELTRKKERILLPFDSRPEMVRFDPGNTVLKEAKVTKAQDWWVKQLTDDPDLIGRFTAAQELGRRRRPALTARVIAAFKADKFWGVRLEIARVLGGIGDDAARDALIEGLKSQEDPRVRRACAEELGGFGEDEAIAAALAAVITRGDRSYYVESAATASYAEAAGAEARELLIGQLKKSSHRDTIREAALRGLGELEDPSLVATLLPYSAGPESLSARRAALAALGTLAGLEKTSEDDRAAIFERIKASLKSGGFRVRQSALTAIGNAGPRAAELKDLVANVAERDAEERIRGAARAVLELLDNKKPKSPDGLKALQKKIAALEKENEAQARRIEMLEAKGGPIAKTKKKAAKKKKKKAAKKKPAKKKPAKKKKNF